EKAVIHEYYRETSRTKLPASYGENYQVIPVGRHILILFSYIYSNNVIPALISSRKIIHYAKKFLNNSIWLPAMLDTGVL
ncbi:2673_t:CDS:1, partial [Funneliformis caledonium]